MLAEYEIIKDLGEGGFGKVVMAIHKKTQKEVAIKFFKTNVIGTKIILRIYFI